MDPRAAGYSPFQILYGRPPPLPCLFKGSLQGLGDSHPEKSLQSLGRTVPHTRKTVLEQAAVALGSTLTHTNQVPLLWSKIGKRSPLSPYGTDHILLRSLFPLLLKLQV